MSTQEFGRMVAEAMRENGVSLRRLGAQIGMLPDGRVVDATMLKRVIEGQRRSVDTHLAWRIIEELHLDPIHAAEAAGVWPPGVTTEMLRELNLTGVGASSVQGKPKNGPFREFPGQRRRVDRRQRDRRHLWLVPAKPAA